MYLRYFTPYALLQVKRTTMSRNGFPIIKHHITYQTKIKIQYVHVKLSDDCMISALL